jgi:hypothetical protein
MNMNELLTPENTAGLIAIGIMVAQFIGKAIPDTATGFLGFVRKLAKFVGLYVPNNEK